MKKFFKNGKNVTILVLSIILIGSISCNICFAARRCLPGNHRGGGNIEQFHSDQKGLSAQPPQNADQNQQAQPPQNGNQNQQAQPPQDHQSQDKGFNDSRSNDDNGNKKENSEKKGSNDDKKDGSDDDDEKEKDSNNQ